MVSRPLGPAFGLLMASLVVAMALGCSALPGRGPTRGSAQEAIADEATSLAPGAVPVKALAPLGEVWAILRKEFVDRDALDPRALGDAAVHAMLAATDDPALRDRHSFAPSALPRPKEVPEDLSIVWDAWAGVFQEFNTAERSLDPVALSQAAVRGLVEAVGDPHTNYISPQRYDLDAPDFAGNYEGIGSEVYRRGGRFVLSPMPGSPAEAAGLRPGDTLVSVDGMPTEDWSIVEVVTRIRGPKGTMVTLEVLHFGEDAPVVLEIKRGVIDLQSITGNITNDGIAFIRLGAFYGNTGDALAERLEEVRSEGARGIVLDLRDNVGGLLSTSIEVASQFLEEGLVTYQLDGSGKRTDHAVKAGATAPNIPLVVLVNQFSASGSEVVAGALQDRGRATLIGLRTFGKGTVNRLKGLSDGGGLYYSFARWYTPNGRLIEGAGLEPDIRVAATAQGGGDPQLAKALEVLRDLADGARS